MSSSIAQANPKMKAESKTARRISLKTFLRDYSDKEDGYKYEWNDGIIEKTNSMNQEQTAIYLLLSRLFCQTEAFQNGGGLTAETDMRTLKKQLRKKTSKQLLSPP